MTVAWSYSRLNKYRQCPLKSYWMDYAPKQAKVVEPPNPIFEKGKEWHKYMENAIKRGDQLPEFLQQTKPLVDAIRSFPEVYVEQQLAFTEDLRETDWFGKQAPVWCRVIWDVAALNHDRTKVVVGDWKGLAVDTPLPTPDGWKTMGDVQEGDTVFDSKGAPCTVVGKSQVHHRPCFKVCFDDTSEVVCDDQHLWVVNGKVLPITEIKNNLTYYGQCYHRVRVADPLVCEDRQLPVDPYILGVWLGDGKHNTGEVTKPDSEFWDQVEARGYELGAYAGQKDRCRAHTILGLRTELREAGLLSNKHIPEVYLRASYEQRELLLQGLMDSDGSVNKIRKQCIFTTCDKRLSDDVKELLLSLGQRPLQSKVKGYGFGKDVMVYPISFRARQGIRPFQLPRKANLVDTSGDTNRSWRRLITDVQEVASVPTQCISVDSADSTYLCGESMIPTHNTGKPRPDSDQLELFAASAFRRFPSVQEVRTQFYFVEHKKYAPQMFHRKSEDHIWQKFGEEANMIATSKENDDWPARPGFHCKYCPVPKSKCQYSQVED